MCHVVDILLGRYTRIVCGRQTWRYMYSAPVMLASNVQKTDPMQGDRMG
jgi:hypothetical protein